MIAPLVLLFALLCTLGFYALVQRVSASCEAGTVEYPAQSAEEWSASLDVALGLDMWSPDHVDNAWAMLPLPSVAAPTTVAPKTIKVQRRTRRTLEMCVV